MFLPDEEITCIHYKVFEEQRVEEEKKEGEEEEEESLFKANTALTQ